MIQRPLHTIRLAGPWEFQMGTGVSEWQSIKLPAAWGGIVETLRVAEVETSAAAHFPGKNGEVLARRRLQCPTGLDDGQKVWIVILAGEDAVVGLRINGVTDSIELISHPRGVACDVSDLLRQTNVVTVEFDIDRLMADDGADSPFNGALIEIHVAGQAAE